MKKILPLVLLCLSGAAFSQNQAPKITFFQADADWTAKQLTVNFEVTDAENDPLEISIFISPDNGKTYLPGANFSASGDVGYPIQPPWMKTITCDLSSLASTTGTFKVRVVADDRQPIDIQSLVNEVDSNSLRNYLQFIEGIRHRVTGATHLQAVRDSLQKHFSGHGLFTEIQNFTFANAPGKNIIGSLPGTASAEKVVIVDAHYDTVADSPGGDDNGSGVAGVMELARILSPYPSKKTLRFIGFDFEESGLIGSQRYVANGIPASETIEGVFNFEMIGFYSEVPGSQDVPTGFNLVFPAAYNEVAAQDFKGNFVSNVGNAASKTLVDLFKNSAVQYVPELRVINLDVPGNGQIVPDLRRSDHTPFWDTNRRALMITDGADFRNDCYHTPQDSAGEKLNYTFMANVVKATLASMAQLAELVHGDWEAATFDNVVSTDNPQTADCQWVLAETNGNAGFSIRGKNCSSAAVAVEIFDEKGGLVFSKKLDAQAGNSTRIALEKALPAGVYFSKITDKTGSVFSQKIVF